MESVASGRRRRAGEEAGAEPVASGSQDWDRLAEAAAAKPSPPWQPGPAVLTVPSTPLLSACTRTFLAASLLAVGMVTASCKKRVSSLTCSELPITFCSDPSAGSRLFFVAAPQALKPASPENFWGFQLQL